MLAATAALLAAASLCPSDPDRLLAAVPEDALAVLALAPLDELRASAAASSWGKLLKSEELAPLVARADELLTETLDGQLEDEDTGARELSDPRAWLAAIHGRALGYVVQRDGDLGGVGLFVEPGEDAEAFDALLGKALELLRQKGAESTQEYQGVELLVIEEAGEEPSISISFEVEGARALIGGPDRAFVLELAQGGIDRMLGKDPSLGFAASAALAEARAGAPAGRAAELFLDLAGMVRMGVEHGADAAADGELAAEEADHVAETMAFLGLDAMRYLHASAVLGEGERFELACSVHLPAGSLLQRAAALLRPAPRDLAALAPADALTLSLGSLDVSGLWQLVRSSVERLAPEQLQQIDAGVAAFEGLSGVRLQQDLLAQITGDFASLSVGLPPDEAAANAAMVAEAQGVPSEDLAELAGYGEAWVVRVEDGSEVESLVDRLLRVAGAAEAIEEEEYQGHTVRFLGEDGQGLHWSFTDELVVFSGTPTPLLAVLARASGGELPSLRDDPRVVALFEAHPQSSYLGMTDARGMAEQAIRAFELLASLIVAQDPESPLAGTLEELAGLLPDPAFVGEHVEGIVFRTVDVQPERLVMRLGGR